MKTVHDSGFNSTQNGSVPCESQWTHPINESRHPKYNKPTQYRHPIDKFRHPNITKTTHPSYLVTYGCSMVRPVTSARSRRPQHFATALHVDPQHREHQLGFLKAITEIHTQPGVVCRRLRRGQVRTLINTWTVYNRQLWRLRRGPNGPLMPNHQNGCAHARVAQWSGQDPHMASSAQLSKLGHTYSQTWPPNSWWLTRGMLKTSQAAYAVNTYKAIHMQNTICKATWLTRLTCATFVHAPEWEMHSWNIHTT